MSKILDGWICRIAGKLEGRAVRKQRRFMSSTTSFPVRHLERIAISGGGQEQLFHRRTSKDRSAGTNQRLKILSKHTERSTGFATKRSFAEPFVVLFRIASPNENAKLLSVNMTNALSACPFTSQCFA